MKDDPVFKAKSVKKAIAYINRQKASGLYDLSKEQRFLYKRTYYRKNQKRIRETVKVRIQKLMQDPEYRKELKIQRRRCNNQARLKLTSGIVKSHLVTQFRQKGITVSAADISQDLVKLKRKQILFKRQLKNLQQHENFTIPHT
jgi:hypothetical protein